MSVRRAIVEVSLDGLNVREFCRVHGVSTWLFYDLRRRHAALGDAALEPRSRAPHRVANRTRGDIEDLVVFLRKELHDSGLDDGPGNIRPRLLVCLGDTDGTRTPSEATIWRILTRHGFITPQPAKAPRHAHRRFACERANECWQLDDTTWTLADGTEVKIINLLDDCTRVAAACQAVDRCTTTATFDTFAVAAAEWGWPQRYLSDNAKAFGVALAELLAALGIAAGHSRPYHPQTCGKVERFHQTQKKFLAAHPAAATLTELQAQLDHFRSIYNHHRPHRALARRHPADVWATTPKSGPANHPLTTRTTTYRATVAANGVITVGHRYDISVGTAYRHRPAIVVITGTACHVFVDGRLTRQFTLNPNRRGQPLYNRLGRPPRTTPPSVSNAPRHP